MQIWYPTHHPISLALVLLKSATYCNNNSHYVSVIQADNTVYGGLFITDYIPPPSPPFSSITDRFSNTPHPPFSLLLRRSPSLCGAPRALSGLKYDMIPASATITQQCGRIVAVSGAAATTASEHPIRLSVSVSCSLPSPPPRSVPCLPVHACLCLTPSASLLIIKSVSFPSLLCSLPPSLLLPPPPPPFL